MTAKILRIITLSFLVLNAHAEDTCETRRWNILGAEKEICLSSSRPLSQLNENTVAIYYFHGMNEGARALYKNQFPQGTEQFCSKNACPDYLWISFDTNRYSFFSDARSKTSGGFAFETWLIKELMPYIEQTYKVCSRRECRWGAGFSMGGMGALKTALRFPFLFSKVTANSPALTPYNAYDSDDLWKEYWSRQRVGGFAGMSLLKAARLIFHNREYADENDPYEIVKNKIFQKGQWPEIYFDVGTEDDFGFDEGVERFRKLLEEKSFPYKAQSFPGKRHLIVGETSKHSIRFLFGE